ncbi:hypothetical protein VTO42DRAFT_4368 [Malbranchea cinnamomea]
MLQSIISRARTALWSGADDGTHQSSAANAKYIFPTVDPEIDGPDCNRDCTDCTLRYPSNFKVDQRRSLYRSAKGFGTHVLVATGKSDWVPRVENEKGSLMEAFKKMSYKSKKGRIMVSASNISPKKDDDNAGATDATTVLVLPAFTFVDRVTAADIPEFVERYVDGSEANNDNNDNAATDGRTRRLVSRPCTRDYIILLCSHRSRDARCGISAPIIKTELERHLRTHNLLRDSDDSRPGGASIYFVSHVGGHTFAANVLVYRREAQQMIWLARIRPEHCEGIVKYTVLQGKVVCPEERLRGGADWREGVMSW